MDGSIALCYNRKIMPASADRKIMCPFLINKLNLHYRTRYQDLDNKRRWKDVKISGQDATGLCKNGNSSGGFNCCAMAVEINLTLNHRRDHQTAIVNGILGIMKVGDQRADGARVGLRNLLRKRKEYQPALSVARRVERVFPDWKPD